MNPILKVLPFVFLSVLLTSCGKQKQILLFTQATESSREAVESAQAEFQKLGKTEGFSVTITENPSQFSEDILPQYAAVVFLYTSGEILDDVQRADLERFVQAGGGLLGAGAMPAVQNEWRWYYEQMNLATSQIAIPSEQLADQIREAIGENKLNYQLATTQRVPEENRFLKEVLDFNLNEPMELDELPGRGILFIERRGTLKLFDFATQTTRQIAQKSLFYGNEDGLLGTGR
jgi:cytochrome c